MCIINQIKLDVYQITTVSLEDGFSKYEDFIILNCDKAPIVLDERFQFSCIEFELGIMVQILTFSCRFT